MNWWIIKELNFKMPEGKRVYNPSQQTDSCLLSKLKLAQTGEVESPAFSFVGNCSCPIELRLQKLTTKCVLFPLKNLLLNALKLN